MVEDWFMLKLYHGSDVEIQQIDLSMGHINKDFGKGFYLTDIKKQAEDMAKRRARTTLFDEQHLTSGEFEVKVFDRVSEEWADFILKNRRASLTGFQHSFDIVVGPVADDGVVLQLNLYEQQYITLSELVERLKYRDINNQYYFGTEKAIQTLQRI